MWVGRLAVAEPAFVGARDYGDPVSKVDAMRALREARRAAGPQPTVTRMNPPAAPAAPTRKAATTPPASEPSSAACGHRSMNGRSCTRDAGHSEKNHRYG